MDAALTEKIKSLLSQTFGESAVSRIDHDRHGYDLLLHLPVERIPELAGVMQREGQVLEFITAVDRADELELVYMFGTHLNSLRVKAVVRAPKGKPVPSISQVFPGADWHERETFDLFGQAFSGHPGLKRLLLPEDADFHPLLKDFQSSESDFNDAFEVCFAEGDERAPV